MSGVSAPVILGVSQCGYGSMIVSLAGGAVGSEYVVWDALPGPYYRTELGGGPVKPNADGVTQVEVLDPRGWGTTSISAVLRGRSGASGYAPSFALRPSGWLGAPTIAPAPVWACGRATAITGHQPGDEVTLFSSGTVRFVIPSAFTQHDYTPAGTPTEFTDQEKLFAQYRTCEAVRASWVAPHPAVSPMSAPVVVQSFPGQLSAPGIVPNSVLPGSARFQLEGIEHGALVTLELVRNGTTSKWSEVCVFDPCPVSAVSGPISVGDELRVSQRLCAGSDSSVAVLTAKDCANVAPPTLARPPRPGDASVALSSYSPGAEIVVYASKSSSSPESSLVPLARAVAGPVVHLYRPVEADDRWIVVAQQSPVCRPVGGHGYVVAD